jgi:hypothetical protein
VLSVLDVPELSLGVVPTLGGGTVATGAGALLTFGGVGGVTVAGVGCRFRVAVVVWLLFSVDFSTCLVMAISASALLCASELDLCLAAAAGPEAPIPHAVSVANRKSVGRSM